MPELPEVQTIISDLQILTGDTFTGFWSDFDKAIKTSFFEKEIVGKKVTSVKRLGKIILFSLDNEKSIAIHLKMTGKLILKSQITNFKFQTNNKNQKPNYNNTEKHLHHIFYLKKYGSLEFHDVRKFATISLLDKEDVAKIKSNYGIDPIDANFSPANLASILEKRKNKPIKQILMDNSVILGIGNIYASEILFNAGISPVRKGETLSKIEIKTLSSSIKKILTKAIRLRGTSVSDYRDSQGLKGSFQDELKVYKKHGQKCKNCDTMIAKVILGQRSTFYCPKCQA